MDTDHVTPQILCLNCAFNVRIVRELKAEANSSAGSLYTPFNAAFQKRGQPFS